MTDEGHTRDLRPPDRPTRVIPPEVLRALLQETRSEDEQRVAEWEDGTDGGQTKATDDATR